ncbi:MarR family transcriptional regulator, partial [Methanoregula sp.]|uniref:helix-turn-helix transcriptional regulator n=1 Tax=Methanoregula sp. TaxID=2052170 RepID=UPI000CAF8632
GGKDLIRLAAITAAVLMLLLVPAGDAAEVPLSGHTITYIITVDYDGSAIWQVEYRTRLTTDADVAAFESYSSNLSAVYLPEIRDLMERSAVQASITASRPMTIGTVTGDPTIQVSPTGKFGVVVYTIPWSGFAKPGRALTIGDAFAGGLYLAKDSTLVIRYPEGFTVASATPPADKEREELIWYGQRSFAAGEPRVVIEQESPVPVILLAAGLIVIIITITAGIFLHGRRHSARADDEPDDAAPALTPDEAQNIGDRIVRLLETHGGERLQSEIVRELALPRSTVSAAIAGLHAKGMVVKVRKGRENLIRLVLQTKEEHRAP